MTIYTAQYGQIIRINNLSSRDKLLNLLLKICLLMTVVKVWYIYKSKVEYIINTIKISQAFLDRKVRR